MDERVKFIAAVREDPLGNFSALCASFGISRAKGYKWVARYDELGPEGLKDLERVARTCPHRTSDEMVARILAMRKERPREGPKKLRARLLQLGVEGVPAASTVGDILERFGLIRPRQRRLRVPPSSEPLAHATEPNHVWCTDFKGHFACGSVRCYPLTIEDAASRYLVKCEGLTEPKEGPVRAQFELAFNEYGLPDRMRSDNGPPFASKSLGGLSRLSVWWIQLGIVPERIEPGHPEQNGRLERFHRTLKESTATPPRPSLLEQQLAFDAFRADYNNARPHEALAMKTPASYYEPSRRVMPSMPRELEYGTDFLTRRVAVDGTIGFAGTGLGLTTLLAGQPVGLRCIDEDEYELFFGRLHIGYVVGRGKKARVEPVEPAD